MYRNLMAEMKRAGMTQGTLAKKVGTTEQNLGYKLRKKRSWRLNEMEKIQEIINYELKQNYTLDYLFAEYEEEE